MADDGTRYGKGVEVGVALRDYIHGVMDRAMDHAVAVPPPDEASERAKARRAALARLDGRGVPLRQAELVVDGGVRETSAVRRVREFMASPPGVLVLAGGKGCGKTTAAALAASYAPTDPYPSSRSGRWPTHLWPRFVYAAAFARVSKYDEEDKETEWPSLLRSWLLVLDDLGMEFVDDRGNFNTMLDEVLATRHGGKRRTILTVNLPLEEFVARYADRIVDRIKEGGSFFEIQDGSFRGRENP